MTADIFYFIAARVGGMVVWLPVSQRLAGISAYVDFAFGSVTSVTFSVRSKSFYALPRAS